jgi:hypothetical protein
MEDFKTWEEMTEKEQLECIFWDMYKDAHGFRPRHMMDEIRSATVEELRKDLDRLQIIIKDNEQQQEEEQARAVEAFETRVSNMINVGARDREMALRWIHEAEGTGGDDEYLCYTVGLPYRYFARETV